MTLKDHLIAAALALAVMAASMTIGRTPDPSVRDPEHRTQPVPTERSTVQSVSGGFP